MTDAEALVGRLVTIPRAAVRPLPPDRYYAFDLVGCVVETPEGASLGTIDGGARGPGARLLDGAARRAGVAPPRGGGDRRAGGPRGAARGGAAARGARGARRVMRIDVVTLFPGMFPGVLDESMLRVARERGAVDIRVVDLRDYTEGRHRVADDYPFGGGGGMVLKPEPLFAAVEALRGPESRVVLLCPQGPTLHAGGRGAPRHARRTWSCSAGTTRASTSASGRSWSTRSSRSATTC